MKAPERILVLGCPGAGKTTLSHRLAHATGLPLQHLDDEYWEADWQRPTRQVWHRRVERLVSADRWIIEGNYLESLALRLPRAQAVVVVDASAGRCGWRVLRRGWGIRHRGPDALPARVRAQVWAGGHPRSTHDMVGLLKLILTFQSRTLPAMLALLAAAEPPPTVVVTALPRAAGRRLRRLSATITGAGLDVTAAEPALVAQASVSGPAPRGPRPSTVSTTPSPKTGTE